ncbi:hypothetical protein MWH25_03080 [Natroniella acetigena]|uniref:hypothetical protein n=1 Tax=Natroniella acetigena TaxID=52004 RepID=UPI00200AF3E6|nr:hypothetical protein [Natroniella acetigena]MCK8826727.1 hypothetical protein [Natroniella acetigena]
MGYHSKITFKEQIKRQIGQFTVIIIKSGANCCEHKGIVCSVEKDFLVLLNNNLKTEIFLDAIVAIKRPIEGVKRHQGHGDCSN